MRLCSSEAVGLYVQLWASCRNNYEAPPGLLLLLAATRAPCHPGAMLTTTPLPDGLSLRLLATLHVLSRTCTSAPQLRAPGRPCMCCLLSNAAADLLRLPACVWFMPHHQGNTQDYYNLDNSCLDHVLASRRGLPMSLAILHRAVGRAAGLDVELVNAPGHVINRVVVAAHGSSNDSSSDGGSGGGGSTGGSTGAAASGQEVLFVDVFAGGKELDPQELR